MSPADEATRKERNHNCARATERVKEVGNATCEPTNRNRIRGGTLQDELASGREAPVAKGEWRGPGGCAAKFSAFIWGDLPLCLKGRR